MAFISGRSVVYLQKIIRALKPSKIVMQTEFEPMYQIYNMADLNPGSGLKNHTENNIYAYILVSNMISATAYKISLKESTRTTNRSVSPIYKTCWSLQRFQEEGIDQVWVVCNYKTF